jgi:hypothetical protein
LLLDGVPEAYVASCCCYWSWSRFGLQQLELLLVLELNLLV